MVRVYFMGRASNTADGRVRMVHNKQNEAIDCPSTPDLTLVLFVGQEIALPNHQYNFGFGKIEGRPTVGSLVLLPHGIPTAKTFSALNVSINFRDLQKRFAIAGIKAPDDFGGTIRLKDSFLNYGRSATIRRPPDYFIRTACTVRYSLG